MRIGSVLAVVPFAILTVGAARSVAAQPIADGGGRVFGLVGGSFGDGDSAPLVAGGAGLRLTRNLGFDVELSHVRNLDLADGRFLIERGLPDILFLPPFEVHQEGTVTAFLSKMTVEFPVAGNRLIPFVTGGGGVGRMAERISFSCAGLCPSILLPQVEHAETGLALTVGGGLDVRLWKALAVGGDVRWVRLRLDRRDLDFAQATARISYRF